MKKNIIILSGTLLFSSISFAADQPHSFAPYPLYEAFRKAREQYVEVERESDPILEMLAPTPLDASGIGLMQLEFHKQMLGSENVFNYVVKGVPYTKIPGMDTDQWMSPQELKGKILSNEEDKKALILELEQDGHDPKIIKKVADLKIKKGKPVIVGIMKVGVKWIEKGELAEDEKDLLENPEDLEELEEFAKWENWEPIRKKILRTPFGKNIEIKDTNIGKRTEIKDPFNPDKKFPYPAFTQTPTTKIKGTYLKNWQMQKNEKKGLYVLSMTTKSPHGDIVHIVLDTKHEGFNQKIFQSLPQIMHELRSGLNQPLKNIGYIFKTPMQHYFTPKIFDLDAGWENLSSAVTKAILPMIDFAHEVDLSHIFKTIPRAKQELRQIFDIKMFNLFKMNEFGAKAECIIPQTVGKFGGFGGTPEKPEPFYVNDSFYLILERPTLKLPLMAVYIPMDGRYWKDPGYIELDEKKKGYAEEEEEDEDDY